MKLRSYIFILLGIGILFFGAEKQQQPYNPIKEGYILKAVMSVLEAAHFSPQNLNDDFSEQVFNQYLDNMDSGRRFLIQSDIDQLDPYKLELDDFVKNGDLTFFELSHGLITKGVSRAQSIYEELIDDEFDHYSDKTIEFDPDKKPFAQNEEELRAYWRDYIQYEIMTRVINKMDSQEKNKEEDEWKSMVELEEEAKKQTEDMFDRYFNNITKLSRLKRFEVFVNSFTSLFDPHTTYFTPKDKSDFKLRMSGSLEGIGARLSPDGDYTKVVEIVPGGPAWKQKELQVDDLILSVSQSGEDAVNAVGLHIDDVVDMIRGKKGTKVTLKVRKVDGTERDISIVREKVILDDNAKAQSMIIEREGDEEKFGYIKLPSFYSDIEDEDRHSCAKDVAQELAKLKKEGVKGIVFDLRNNGGGYFHEVINMSGLFIKEGPIVQAKGRKGGSLKYYDEDPEIHYEGPLVVLVNEYSASASEILAAALQDYNRAIIVGSSATFGKGTVQRFYNLDRIIRADQEFKPLGEIKLTTQTYYRVNGGSTQLKGVTPDVVLPGNYQYLEIGEREYEHSIPWSAIDALKYESAGYFTPDVEYIQSKSAVRVANDESFQLVEENAKRLKDQREVSSYSLNLDTYRSNKKSREDTAKKFKSIRAEIEELSIENIQEDLAAMQTDSTKIGRNEALVKAMQKDMYLNESLFILQDIIASERLAKVGLKE